MVRFDCPEGRKGLGCRAVPWLAGSAVRLGSLHRRMPQTPQILPSLGSSARLGSRSVHQARAWWGCAPTNFLLGPLEGATPEDLAGRYAIELEVTEPDPEEMRIGPRDLRFWDRSTRKTTATSISIAGE